MQDILHYDFNRAITSATAPKLLSADVLAYKRILVVDDSMTTRSMIKNILINLGYSVDAVLDATEALVKLKMSHYDLIITDINMPKMDGYEFIEILRNDEMYMDIPIIAISAINREDAMKRLHKLKVDGYIQKDLFNQKEFINKIEETLTKYHA